jgi:polar amino acid transport system substrate-binding protein
MADRLFGLTRPLLIACVLLASAACGPSTGPPPSAATSAPSPTSAPAKPAAAPTSAASPAASPAAASQAASPAASPAAAAAASPSPAAAAAGVARDDTLAQQVPQQYRAKGELTVDVTVFPSFEIFGPNNEIQGADPDLYQALGQVLGLRFNLINTQFASIIPGIQAGRFDLSSPLGDFVERQEVVSFVDYSRGGSSMLVKAGGSFQPHDVSDLCGHTVGIETGTAEDTVTQMISEQCQQAGKTGLTVNTYPDVAAATLAVSSGRADGLLTDSAANGYTAKQSGGQFASMPLSGGESLPGFGATFGIVFQKDSGLGAPLLGALQKLVAAGVYDRIFDQWGLQDNKPPHRR